MSVRLSQLWAYLLTDNPVLSYIRLV